MPFVFNLQQLPGCSLIFNPVQQQQQQFSPQQQSQRATTL
ncbi:PREDICTED: transcription factor SPT20 homolog [Tinamus guttatus]|nr:PREDICTED: transcription factor SPT20 homolog [Tinamus guttatus]